MELIDRTILQLLSDETFEARFFEAFKATTEEAKFRATVSRQIYILTFACQRATSKRSSAFHDAVWASCEAALLPKITYSGTIRAGEIVITESERDALMLNITQIRQGSGRKGTSFGFSEVGNQSDSIDDLKLIFGEVLLFLFTVRVQWLMSTLGDGDRTTDRWTAFITEAVFRVYEQIHGFPMITFGELASGGPMVLTRPDHLGACKILDQQATQVHVLVDFLFLNFSSGQLEERN
jgi:hypothetical protein